MPISRHEGTATLDRRGERGRPMSGLVERTAIGAGAVSRGRRVVTIKRLLAGLAVTLGLIGLAVVVVRRFGPETIRRLSAQRAARRLSVVETLVLDPSRRLVLVRFDAEERLILLGDGQVIPARSAPSPES